MMKTPPAAATKINNVGAAESAPVVSTSRRLPRSYDVMHVAFRLVCLSASMAAVVVMTTAKQKSTISLYGFDLPVYSKWSFSDSFDYLVGVSAAAAVHSCVQLVMTSRMLLLRKSSTISSRNHAWLLFAADQVFAYAMMSGGSAASGVTNLNRTGIKHSLIVNLNASLRFHWYVIKHHQ